MAYVAGVVPIAGARAWGKQSGRDGGSMVCPQQRGTMVPTRMSLRPGVRPVRVSVVHFARAVTARGGGGKSQSRAQGAKRGKPLQAPQAPSSSKAKRDGKNNSAQSKSNASLPPRAEGNVRPAGIRSRVGVKATASGSPYADLRQGPLLSPASRKNPEKAREERKKLWERLGANAGGETGYAHLLENVGVRDKDSTVQSANNSKKSTQRGSGRGASGTRQRGSSRATLIMGFTAHREKFAKALRLELEEEMERAEERLRTWPKERLRSEGYALFGLRGLHDGTLQKDAVVRVLIPRKERDAPPPVVETGDILEKDGSKTTAKTSPQKPRERQFALGTELPFHRFGQGDMVSLVEGDEHDESGKVSVTGIVVERAMHFLKIAVDEEDEGVILSAGKLRLDLSANTVSHDRALQALVAFSDVGGMAGYAEVSSSSDRSTTGTTRLSSTAYAPLQRALIGIPDGDTQNSTDSRKSISSLASKPPPWGTKDNSTKVNRAISSTNASGLNQSQQIAVRRGLTRTLSIWQGPPGTGKTKALVAFVEAAVALSIETKGVGGGTAKQSAKSSGASRSTGKQSNTSAKHSESSPIVLACAASNVAVDNIVSGLVNSDTKFGNTKRPLRVVRLGSPAKVQANLERYTLTAQASEGPLGKQAAAIRATVKGDYTSRGARARREAYVLEQQAERSILRHADVVCSTCVGAGDDLLEGFTFRVACVDEAAQCPEPAALIPVTKALTSVLVGDARQLPPTVTSREALNSGLGVSLFERMERLGVVPDLLNTQYRMHPSLAQFPSLAFYRGEVKSSPTPEDRVAPSGIQWPKKGKHPVVFVEVSGGKEQRESDGLSISNPVEARIAIKVTEALLLASRSGSSDYLPIRSSSDVGIIAPYRAQVRRVKELWAQTEFGKSEGRSFRSYNSIDNSSTTDNEDSNSDSLEVHSVDGFQGREKEVIVLCTTRSNDKRALGFVSDQRRLNVAMTRAKRGLIVLGNRATLSSDPTWAAWFQWIDKKGLSINAEDVGK